MAAPRRMTGFLLRSSKQAIRHCHLPTALLALLAVSAWLIYHSYRGIAHDGVLYAAQALAWLDPDAFRGDVFFLFGSQSDYSLFPALYGRAIEHFGLPDAAFVMLVLAHGLWIAAAAWLMSAFFAGKVWWVALILLFAWPGSYGGPNVFWYAEGFVTARSYAEPAVLIALGSLARGWRWRAWAASLIAATLHPLTALPAFGLLWLVSGFDRQGWRLQLALVLLAAALMLAGVGPLANVSVFIDPEWRRELPFYLLFSGWAAADFMKPVWISVLLALGAYTGTSTLRRQLFQSALALMLTVMALSALADHWPNALLVQLQLWRALWLGKILAVIAFVFLIRDHWQHSAFARLILLAIIALSMRQVWPEFIIFPLVGLIFFLHLRGTLQPVMPQRLVWLGYGLCTLVVLSWLMDAVRSLPYAIVPADGLEFPHNLALFPQFFWRVPTLLPLLALTLVLPDAGRTARLAAPFVVAIVCLAVLTWNVSSWKGAPVASFNPPHNADLDEILPKGRLVYWADDPPEYPWLVLRRGNYVSDEQLAGVVFSRATTMEGIARIRRTQGLTPHQRAQPDTAPARGTVAVRQALRHVCADQQLDYVVLTGRPVDEAARRLDVVNQPPWWVYACNRWR